MSDWLKFRHPRLSPRSVRAQSALAAALTVATLFTGAAAWAHEEFLDQATAAATTQAEDELQQIVGLVARGIIPGDGWGPFPYEIVAGDGRAYYDSSPDMWPFDRRGASVLPAPGYRSDNPDDVRYTARFPRSRLNSPLAGLILPAVGDDVKVGDIIVPPGTSLPGRPPPTEIIRTYVVITPFQVDDLMSRVDAVLFVAVPLCVALVAAVAYLATRRALRSVEAIRVCTAAVAPDNPRQRVQVPESGDEIAALATTINSTLQRLQDVSTARARFVADASHELRSPLTTLSTGLEIALAYPERTDWKAAVVDAVRQTRRLQTLAEDLLLLASAEGGEAPARRRVDLVDLLRDVVADRQPGDIVITLPAPSRSRPVPVLGNGEQLSRLIRNLLDNAVRHARHEVTLTTWLNHGVTGGVDAVLEVSDDGPGVPEAERETIFQPFTRIDQTRTRSTGGAGLGLAIADDIARRHGGKLSVGDGPSMGACFRFELPAVPD